MEKDIAKIVISEEQIRNKLLELSKTLISDYTGKRVDNHCDPLMEVLSFLLI